MTKYEYMSKLSNALSPLPLQEKNDILNDFEEHFTAAMANGKTEEEISEALGNPENSAQQYLKETDVEVKNISPIQNTAPQMSPQSVMPPPAPVPQGNFYNQPPQNMPNHNQTMPSTSNASKGFYLVLFFLGIFFVGIPLYTTALAFVIGGIVLFSTAFVFSSLGSMLVLFLIFTGIFCVALGILLAIGTTALLRFLFRKWKA